MSLKFVNKYVSQFGISIILSIILHFFLVFFLSYNHSKYTKKINDYIINESININMIDFPKTVGNNDYDKQSIQKSRILKKKLVNVNNDRFDQIQDFKRKKVDDNVLKKIIINTTKKENNYLKTNFDVDDLLDKLSNNKGMRSNSYISEKKSLNNIECNLVTEYKKKIHKAISDKFYNASNYIGLTCDLQIKITADGRLVNIISAIGDPSLCQSAILAAKLAIIPKPPNHRIYTLFQDTTIRFSPK